MSTRCQIGIYETQGQDIGKPSVLLYKHSDGYPDGVLPIIEPFLKDFKAKRGLDDFEYCAAWLLYSLMAEAMKQRAQYAKRNDKYPSILDYTGYGIGSVFYWDIEYYYRVHPNELRVYETHCKEDPQDWTLIQTIPL
jgi:hypothetical protein